MTKPPAFQLYVRDWLSDSAVRLMGPDGKGLYIDLMCIQWLEGDVPPDEDEIAALVGYPVDDLWPMVRGRFRGKRQGRVFNIRLDDQRRRYQVKRELASKAGKRSGEVRRQQRAETSTQRTDVRDPLERNANTASASSVATAKKDSRGASYPQHISELTQKQTHFGGQK